MYILLNLLNFQYFHLLEHGWNNVPFLGLTEQLLSVDGGLLGCDTLWNCRCVSTFRRVMPPSSGMKVAAKLRGPPSTSLPPWEPQHSRHLVSVRLSRSLLSSRLLCGHEHYGHYLTDFREIRHWLAFVNNDFLPLRSDRASFWNDIYAISIQRSVLKLCTMISTWWLRIF